jgi:hypothetical protein
MDLTIVAYATLALSLFVSAIKMGGFILNADPRSIVNAGRWGLAVLPILALAALVWLTVSGRSTAAMLLAAFLLPVFVQAAPRWRVLFGGLGSTRGGLHPFASDLGGAVVPVDGSTPRQSPDPELVARSIAVLQAYLEDARPQTSAPALSQIEHRPVAVRNAPVNGGNGHMPISTHMSTQEAFAILGLVPMTSPREVKEAHRRLAQMVDPEVGGSRYLLTKIDEARDVLLGD